MKTAKAGETFLIRLDPGEEILESLHEWCRSQGIVNATISGIGSVENPTLAHYNHDTKQFVEKKLEGIYEVTAIQGNVGAVGDQPLVHLHLTLANAEMQAFGGHLVQAVCAATVELSIQPLPTTFRKDFNESIGLKIWNFETK